MINTITKNAGSFRDPAGHVYEHNNQIFRLVNEAGRKQYEFIAHQGIIESSIAKGYLIPSKEIAPLELAESHNCAYVLEHRKIPYISYPYEWSFYHLKQAALHHLAFQLFLLKKKVH